MRVNVSVLLVPGLAHAQEPCLVEVIDGDTIRTCEGRIRLVWGFLCQGLRASLFRSLSFFVPFFGLTRAASILPSRPQILPAVARRRRQGRPSR